jgi:hypothetical protein
MAQVVEVVEVGHVQRRVEAADRFAGGGHELLAAFRGAGQGLVEGGLLPAVAGFGKLGELGLVVHGTIIKKGTADYTDYTDLDVCRPV